MAFFFLNNGETRIWDVSSFRPWSAGLSITIGTQLVKKHEGGGSTGAFSVLLAADSLSKRQEVANVKRCPAAADLHQR